MNPNVGQNKDEENYTSFSLTENGYQNQTVNKNVHRITKVENGFKY